VAFRAYRLALLNTLRSLALLNTLRRSLLVPDIGAHCSFILVANCFGKVAIVPEALAPEKLLEFGELLTDYATGAAFQNLDDIGNAFLGQYLDQQVNMVGLYTQLMNVPTMHVTSLSKQIF